MYLHVRSGASIASMFLALGSIFLANTLSAATASPGLPVGIAASVGLPCLNPHKATEAEANSVPDGSIIAGVTWLCPEAALTGITAEAGEAKVYLLSIARNLRDSQAPPTKERIDPLNNSFAICAARFLHAYENTVGQIYVVSAFRCGPYSPVNMTCDRGENRRAGGAIHSNHQLGLAIDVNPASGNYEILHEFARVNPQYGVWFRHGMSDRPHLEPVDRESPSCSGVAGTSAVQPNIRTPSSDLTDRFRDFITTAEQKCTLPDGLIVKCSEIANFGNPPTSGALSGISGVSPSLPSSGSSGSQTTSSSNEPTTCAPRFFCSGSTLYYRTSTCVDQVNQVCANGCSTGACIGSSSGADPLAAALADLRSTSTQGTSTQPISAFDQISVIANAAPVGDAADPQAPVLIVSGEEAARLEDTSPPGTLVPLGSVQMNSPGAQQTFISPDLRYTPAVTPQNFASQQTTLEIMKETLLRILAYLRPFGRPYQYFE